jgi:acyl-CoA thioesterase
MSVAKSKSQTAIDVLISILDLEELEVNTFRGQSPQDERQRVFGGQVAGQAQGRLVVSVAQEGLLRPAARRQARR